MCFRADQHFQEIWSQSWISKKPSSRWQIQIASTLNIVGLLWLKKHLSAWCFAPSSVMIRSPVLRALSLSLSFYRKIDNQGLGDRANRSCNNCLFSNSGYWHFSSEYSVLSLHFWDAYLNHQNYQPWTYLKGSNLVYSTTDTHVHPVSIAYI